MLFGIARNLALNALRDARRRGQVIGPALDNEREVRCPGRRPDEMAQLNELDAMIRRGLEALSPAHREILVLREFNGLDYDAIAKVIRCRKGTVRSRLARAREQLRVCIEQSRGGEV
ncbi:MAG: sigma-70 family RNA polymerase sigma factor [Candidatus Hydrogenedentes bacterium]|nr:sigma-70 family RNA polymerase sigma factor [Candidatus Hydrogenedentota bacterium]